MKVAGVAYVKANGLQFEISGTCTVSPSRFEREAVVGLAGVVGYKEIGRTPFIEIDAVTTPDLDIEALDGLTDCTVTAELANGQNWVLTNAWRAGASEIDAVEGKVPVRFEGLACEKF